MSFARTKIQLPRPKTHVERPRLQARLAAGLAERRLVLLCAGAGYGKTSALAWQMAQMADTAQKAVPTGTPTAWIACDHGDTPLVLFEGLIAALEPFDLPWLVSPQALVARAAEADSAAAHRALAAELINALDASEVPHGVIAIDDLHRVDQPGVIAFLAYLLERGSRRWTFAVATRLEPAWPLARWRAGGELLELREDDLRFSAAEARALAGAAASDELLTHLLERTQGWPAGLGLALRLAEEQRSVPAALQGSAEPGTVQGDAALALLVRAERSWFELLTTEVIDQLPPRLAEFLLATSVLTELTPARAAAVSGMADAAALLDEVERRGHFVTVIDTPRSGPTALAQGGLDRTLRLHDLFRDALARRLRLVRPAALPDLLRRAAAGEPDPLRRIGTLLQAEDWAAAEAQLEHEAGALLTAGARAAVQGLLDRFPATEQARPALELIRGMMAWARWDWAEMPLAVARAAAAYRQSGDVKREGRCLAYLAIAQSGAGDQEGMARTVARLAEHEGALTLDPASRCRVLLARLWQALHDDRRDEIAALLTEQVSILERVPQLHAWYENVPVPSMAGMPGTRDALTRYVHGVLRRAPEEPVVVRGMALVLRAWLELHAGDWEAAERSAALADEDCRWLAEPPGLQFQLRLVQVQLLALRGRYAAALVALEEMITEAQHPAVRAARALALPLVLYFGRRIAAQAEDAAAFESLLARTATLGAGSDRFLGPLTSQVHDAYRAALHGHWPEAAACWQRVLGQPASIGLFGQAIELPLRAADALLHLGRGTEAGTLVADTCHRVRETGDAGSMALAGPAVLGRIVASPAWSGEAADRELMARWLQRLQAWQAPAAGAPARVADVARTTPVAGMVPGGPPPDVTDGPGAREAVLDREGALPRRNTGALSERETEVLALIAAGESNKLIARALDISPHTVKRHVANILDKLGLASRGQAAAWHHQAAGSR
ncbi:MAG: transcriptional regulator [Rubrivivax sp.]|nr:transcriptional regulator [Rubrivivax sp.]